MSHEVTSVEVVPTVLASTRQRIVWSEVSTVIRSLFDRVYAFLRESGVKPAGHNVCIYHDAGKEGAMLECGVQVAAPFEGRGEVVCSATPAGTAATTAHIGAYAQLGAAHDAISAWCRAQGLQAAGPNWEIYGDWTDDVTALRTDVYRLIEAAR